jgi:antitoxin component YwqK of YwqJK toxin-antitoxin module
LRLAFSFLVAQLLIGCTHITVNSEFIDTKSGLIFYENKVFTGDVITFSADNDTIELCTIKRGKRHGKLVRWYPDGSVKEERYFKDNRRDGFHQKWYPTGVKAFEYRFKNGVYVDTLKEWYPNGQLYLLSHNKNGQPSGRQKAWRENGELYLNYDVVYGRKYGNAGIKHCKSLWSEVVDSL